MYKDLPFLPNHPQAAAAAEAAECAGEQGKYWEMHRELFRASSEWDTTADAARSSFTRYGDTIGLHEQQFVACLEDGRYRGNVEANMAEGRHLGVTGTPSFIINGKILSGAHPYEVFRSAFEKELR